MSDDDLISRKAAQAAMLSAGLDLIPRGRACHILDGVPAATPRPMKDAPRDGWQPIEKAPRETWVVIGKPTWQLFPKAKYGSYGSGEDGPFDGWLFADEFTPCVVPNVDGEPFLGWQEDIDEGNMPTHWMPLPPPARRRQR